MVSELIVRALGVVYFLLGAFKLHGILLAEGMWRDYLNLENPLIVFVPNTIVLGGASILEAVVGFVAMRKGSISLRSGLLLWCASVAFLYKFGLALVRYEGPCGCLFGINRLIPISLSAQNDIADFLLLGTLLLSGSVLLLQGSSREAGRSS